MAAAAAGAAEAGVRRKDDVGEEEGRDGWEFVQLDAASLEGMGQWLQSESGREAMRADPQRAREIEAALAWTRRRQQQQQQQQQQAAGGGHTDAERAWAATLAAAGADDEEEEDLDSEDEEEKEAGDNSRAQEPVLSTTRPVVPPGQFPLPADGSAVHVHGPLAQEEQQEAKEAAEEAVAAARRAEAAEAEQQNGADGAAGGAAAAGERAGGLMRFVDFRLMVRLAILLFVMTQDGSERRFWIMSSLCVVIYVCVTGIAQAILTAIFGPEIFQRRPRTPRPAPAHDEQQGGAAGGADAAPGAVGGVPGVDAAAGAAAGAAAAAAAGEFPVAGERHPITAFQRIADLFYHGLIYRRPATLTLDVFYFLGSFVCSLYPAWEIHHEHAD